MQDSTVPNPALVDIEDVKMDIDIAPDEHATHLIEEFQSPVGDFTQ